MNDDTNLFNKRKYNMVKLHYFFRYCIKIFDNLLIRI